MSGIIPKTCFAFLGAAGGAGVTGAVIETGYAALKTKPASGGHAPRVCLMDLDFENGALASYLDIAAGVDTGVMSGDPARIDGALTSAFVTKHDSGLRLLAAPGRLGGNDDVNPNFTGFVAVDTATPRNAMNCGQPAGGLQADSRYAKDMAARARP